MPNSSGTVVGGSEIPGEVIRTDSWRLDSVNMMLSGKVEIALPIGERQARAPHQRKNHPERYDENGPMKLPTAGMVSFTFDAMDMLSQTRIEHPNIPTQGSNVTAQVSEVCYSPLLTYITLALEGDADAIAAYKAKNGEGLYNSDGLILWAYGGVDVFVNWVSSLALVDGDGTLMFPDNSDYNGCGNEWAEFVYPHIKNIPDELYLAPIEGDVANMAQAVRVK